MQRKMIWEPEINSEKCSFLLVVEQVTRELIPPLLPKSELKTFFIHSLTFQSQSCVISTSSMILIVQIKFQFNASLPTYAAPDVPGCLAPLPFPPIPSPYHRESPGFKVQHTITSGIGDRLDCKRCRQEIPWGPMLEAPRALPLTMPLQPLGHIFCPQQLHRQTQ